VTRSSLNIGTMLCSIADVYDAMRPTTIENMMATTFSGWKKNAWTELVSTGAIADVFPAALAISQILENPPLTDPAAIATTAASPPNRTQNCATSWTARRSCG
jgi:hypothetical protein